MINLDEVIQIINDFGKDNADNYELYYLVKDKLIEELKQRLGVK